MQLSREEAKDTTAEKSAMGKLVFQAVFGQKRVGMVGKIPSRSAEVLENPPQWTISTLPWKIVK
jgi:hypothetical protein